MIKGRKIERALLIYPPVTFSVQSMKQCHLPLGIAYLASAIRDICEVYVLDCAVEGYENEERVGERFLRYGLGFDEIEKRIKQIEPDLVGISCIFSSQFPNALEVARRAKKVNPETITVLGGSHPTFVFKKCLENKEIDFIVRGEGEFALRELILAFANEDGSWREIEGICWQEDGKIYDNGLKKPYPNLDEIPFPARDMFPLEKYHKISQPMGIVYKNRPFMNLITSRGCPYRCTFCSSTNFWGNKYRTRSVENVLSEMEELVERYGIREFKFFDDNLTADLGRAKRIFQGMIERGFNVSWNTPNGIHIVNLDTETIDLMIKSGCYELTIAVESGDPWVLKNIINKPTDLSQLEEVTEQIKRKKLGTYGFFIIGFPGETKEQIQRTLDFSRKLGLDRISCFIANPLPGTKILEICQQKGYLKPDYTFDDIDFFEARFDTENWTNSEIQTMRKKWFWQYNLSLLFRHPIRFLKRYKTILFRPKLLYEIIKRRIRR